ncbi:argininosuccinate synthase [Porticoccaceae bacterium]|nr:argininosuccinate synthase [Porticoccaceae bacterium]
MSSVNKVVLAYSGGLDTSVIVKWLQEEYNCEVVTFTADIGQGEEVEPARAKAEALGVKEIYIDDLREEYARDLKTRKITRVGRKFAPATHPGGDTNNNDQHYKAEG